MDKRALDRWSSTSAALIDQELAQEMASTLGRLGRNLEAALHALAAFDGARSRAQRPDPTDTEARRTLIVEAAEALWLLLVQREALGLSSSRAVIEDYKVPGVVQRAVGAMPQTSRPRGG